MEGMIGEVYIDNADDLDDLDHVDYDEHVEFVDRDDDMDTGEEIPDEWRQLRDNLLERAGGEVISSHNWTYSETDVIILRECAELTNSEVKNTINSIKSYGDELLECSWCDDIFLTQQQMTRHWLLCHLQWDTRCEKCQLPMNNSVARHECNYTCPVCDKVCKSKYKLMRHLFKNHSKFYCCLCEKIFDSLEEMRSHVDRENMMLEKFCILCKSSLNKCPDGFKDHLLKSHFGPIVINKPTVFEDKTSSNSEIELITHISMNYKPNKTETYLFDNYSCPHCQRKFSAKSGLKIHVGIAHKGGKIIFCSRCPSAFATVTDCKKHFREEHGYSNRAKHKKKLLLQDDVEPVRSCVPTNLPVEGSEKHVNIIANVNNNNSSNNNNTVPEIPEEDISLNPESQTVVSEPVVKKKAKRPIPGLVKIDAFHENTPIEGVVVNPPPLLPSEPEVQHQHKPKPKTKKVILTPKESTSSTTANIVMTPSAKSTQPILVASGYAPAPLNSSSPVTSPLPASRLPQVPVSVVTTQSQSQQQAQANGKQIKTILPNSMAPNSYQPVILKNNIINSTPQQQVYVPAMTSSGTTILMKLEEAQKHLNNGVVTFLPSASASNSSGPGQGIKMPSPAPTITNNVSTPSQTNDDKSADIMREKVALNLPVVMTKRTNKKLAQDNPFFKIKRNNGDLDGECRTCEAAFSMKNPQLMVQHYRSQHSQEIQINAFPLYYEISHKINKNGSKATIKFFLCHFCGKEFTTKFNVRRHQMLYCVRKDEINPKDLGLGKVQEDDQEEQS